MQSFWMAYSSRIKKRDSVAAKLSCSTLSNPSVNFSERFALVIFNKCLLLNFNATPVLLIYIVLHIPIVFLLTLFRPWTLFKHGILRKFQANILNYHTHTTFTPDPKSSLPRERITFSLHCCLLLGNWNNNEASTFVSFYSALKKWKLLFLLHCIKGDTRGTWKPTLTHSHKESNFSLVLGFCFCSNP